MYKFIITVDRKCDVCVTMTTTTDRIKNQRLLFVESTTTSASTPKKLVLMKEIVGP